MRSLLGFDATALVFSLSSMRKVTEKLEVKDIHLMDGPKFSNGKTADSNGRSAEVRTACLWKERRGKDSLPTEETPR